MSEGEASVMQIGLSPPRDWQPEGLLVALGNRAVQKKKIPSLKFCRLWQKSRFEAFFLFYFVLISRIRKSMSVQRRERIVPGTNESGSCWENSFRSLSRGRPTIFGSNYSHKPGKWVREKPSLLQSRGTQIESVSPSVYFSYEAV